MKWRGPATAHCTTDVRLLHAAVAPSTQKAVLYKRRGSAPLPPGLLSHQTLDATQSPTNTQMKSQEDVARLLDEAIKAVPYRPRVPVPHNLWIQVQEDVARLPDEADEAAYEAMPIEEFGAAMLRGMGWSEGQVPG